MNLTFLPWVRQGLSTALSSPTAAARPVMSVEVKLQHGSQAVRSIDVAAELLGPGDVVAVDRSAVIRTYPSLDGQITDDALVAVELDRADFPWLFSPNAAADGKLVPWLQLVVVEPREGVRLEDRPGQNAVLRLDGAAVVASELPPPDEAWAYAHAQIAGVSVTAPEEIAVLVRDKPTQVSSRLLAARRLQKGKRYRACVVPTYELGRRAGLGLPTGGAGLRLAWSLTATRVELPVYFHWTFVCSDQGGFRELAEKLAPRKLGPEVGRRRVFAVPVPTLRKGFAFELPGVLGALDAPPAPVAAADARRFAAAIEALHAKRKTLVPPRYGHSHAPNLAWVDGVNKDPALRAAAALGTRVVQRQQEALIAAVREQIDQPMPAMAEAASEVNRAILSRFFGAREQPKASTEIVARVIAAAATTAAAALAPSTLPAVRRLSTIAGRASLLAKVRKLDLSAVTLAPPQLGMASFQRGGAAMPSPMGIVPKAADDWPKSPRFKLVSERTPLPLGAATVEFKVELPSVSPLHHQPIIVPRKRLVDVPWHLHQTQPQDTTDSADAAQFRAAARAVLEQLATLTKRKVPLGTLLSATVDPALLMGVFSAVRAPRDVSSQPTAAPSPPAAAPSPPPRGLGIRYPMWRALVEIEPEAMLPNLGRVPMDTIGLLGVNGAVVEAFLAGLNHELLREVRWRKVPVNELPTFFDSVLTGEPEVPSLDKWTPEGNLLPPVRHSTVLIVRGALIRNQPRVTIYAVREGQPQSALPPAFEGLLDDSTRFVGFPIAAAALRAAEQRWLFVLEEQPTEPCFTAPPDAAPGPLRVAAFAVASSATLATARLRRPFRVVIPAVDVVSPP